MILTEENGKINNKARIPKEIFVGWFFYVYLPFQQESVGLRASLGNYIPQ